MELNNASYIYWGSSEVQELYLGGTLIWPPAGLDVGTVYNFDYTGSVQSIDLPRGYYKLQCWGAQGGNVTGSYSVAGSKGGYSEGILKLDSPTTLYVFVGGKGANYTSSASQTSTTLISGGWNGGGCGAHTCLYSGSSEDGKSFPRPGGGATDIALVTSDMSYSSNRTNRSSESLLSRIIVAGGGAGASAFYQEIDTYEETENLIATSWTSVGGNSGSGNSTYPKCRYHSLKDAVLAGGSGTYRVEWGSASDSLYYCNYEVHTNDSKWTKVVGKRILAMGETDYTNTSSFDVDIETYPPGYDGTSNYYAHVIYAFDHSSTTTGTAPTLYNPRIYKIESTGSTETDYGTATTSKQGGGTSGKGQYPGTQTSAGSGGGFGLGANQTSTNYMYCGGGGGGGWYGGGSGKADSATNYINYCGGGSGFVNISANSSSLPTNYNGLTLLSGSTKAGNTSFPSTSGGSETGHSGNGYARITVVDENGNGGGSTPSTPSISINWSTQTGTWNSSSNSSAYDGLSYTCISPGDSGSTRVRCTFSGATSITFTCVQSCEYNYDFLNIGYLDSACTSSSYQYTMDGVSSGTVKSYTFTCDGGEHYVEFCYTKDYSVSNGSDNATVYVSAVS